MDEAARAPRTKAEVDALVAALEQTGDHQVLRRLTPRPLHRCGPNDGLRCAIVVDTETTGHVLSGGAGDVVAPEIVSFAMVAVAYNPADGAIKGGVGRSDWLR